MTNAKKNNGLTTYKRTLELTTASFQLWWEEASVQATNLLPTEQETHPDIYRYTQIRLVKAAKKSTTKPPQKSTQTANINV